MVLIARTGGLTAALFPVLVIQFGERPRASFPNQTDLPMSGLRRKAVCASRLESSLVRPRHPGHAVKIVIDVDHLAPGRNNGGGWFIWW